MTQMKSQRDIKNRMNKITELCGCEFNSNMEYRKAKTGICIIDYKGNPQDVDYGEFTGIKRNLFVEPKITAFSGTTLTGEKYEKGKWILLQ